MQPKTDFLLVTVCLGLFIYQFAYFTKVYLAYPTTTSVHYGHENMTDLPAVYFCLWRPFSVRQMLSKSNLTSYLVSDGKDVDYNETSERFGANSLKELDMKLLYEFIKLISSGSLKEALADESILADFEIKIPHTLIQFWNGSEVMEFKIEHKKDNKSCGRFCPLFQPKSYVFSPNKFKCFSFFTADSFGKHCKNVKQISAINEIRIRHRNLLPPYWMDQFNEMIMIAVAAKDAFPGKLSALQKGSLTSIDLGKIEIFGLEPPYDTRCRHYKGVPPDAAGYMDSSPDGAGDSEGSPGGVNYMGDSPDGADDPEGSSDGAGYMGDSPDGAGDWPSQSHCMARCMFDDMNPNPNGTVNLYIPYPIGLDYFKPGHRFQLFEEDNIRTQMSALKARERCRKRCPIDCVQTSYRMIMSSVFHPEMSENTTLFMTQDGMPKVEIRHKPEMSFLSYMGTVGGLGGLWLGASILAVSRMFAQFLKLDKYCKPKKSRRRIHVKRNLVRIQNSQENLKVGNSKIIVI